ncbi:sialidase family protein [Pseudarthrobacter sp. L19]|uniref:sialidase family protein n=1 Tax=Pseudarthrobacter sp. L19 TaxID=3423951 RepID=UPI003D796FCB
MVISAWDGRPTSAADAPNPNSIVLRRSTDGGVTWDAQRTVLAGFADSANNGANKFGYSDPSLVWDASAGKLFLFSVYSKDAGFSASNFGNDDADRSIISAQVSESTDLGITWGAPRLITSVVKPGATPSNPQPGDVKGMFAASGEGIQLKYGSRAGRLVQQFTGTVRQANGSDAIQAYSVYSDDHGATWQRGAFVGTAMDENKTVELSDGRLMLNSRSNNAADNARKVATSSDGGTTYGPVTIDTSLSDPANNASIFRLFPDAAAGTSDAKMLVFTNANDPDTRQNVSARVSCDDGISWGVPRTIRAGFSAYSTGTRLGTGQIGVLYEASYSSDLEFARFSDDWLNSCTPAATASPTTVAGVSIAGSRADASRDLTTRPYTAGETIAYQFTVKNTNTGAVTVAPTSGNFAPLVPPGSGNCRYSNLAPGAAYSCTTPLHTVTQAEVDQGFFVPDTQWSISGNATGTGRVLGLPVNLSSAAQAGTATIAGVTVNGSATNTTRNVGTTPYTVGEQVSYQFTVKNNAGTAVDVIPTAGNFAPFVPPGTGNCRYTGLAASASYLCSTPKHTVTSADLSLGYFVPDTSWNVVTAGNTSAGRLLGQPVRLK